MGLSEGEVAGQVGTAVMRWSLLIKSTPARFPARTSSSLTLTYRSSPGYRFWRDYGPAGDAATLSVPSLRRARCARSCREQAGTRTPPGMHWNSTSSRTAQIVNASGDYAKGMERVMPPSVRWRRTPLPETAACEFVTARFCGRPQSEGARVSYRVGTLQTAGCLPWASLPSRSPIC
jgi:hypothetical protein